MLRFSKNLIFHPDQGLSKVNTRQNWIPTTVPPPGVGHSYLGVGRAGQARVRLGHQGAQGQHRCHAQSDPGWGGRPGGQGVPRELSRVIVAV